MWKSSYINRGSGGTMIWKCKLWLDMQWSIFAGVLQLASATVAMFEDTGENQETCWYTWESFMGCTGDMSWYMQIYDSHDVGMFDNPGEKETNISQFEPFFFWLFSVAVLVRWTPFGIPQQLVSSLRLSMSCCFNPCPVSLLAVGRPPGVPISWTVFLVTPLALWIG